MALKHPKMERKYIERLPRTERHDSPMSSKRDCKMASMYQESGAPGLHSSTFSGKQLAGARKQDCATSTVERCCKRDRKRLREECDDNSWLNTGTTQTSGAKKWIGSSSKFGIETDQRHNYGVYPQLKKKVKMSLPPRREFIPVEGGRPLQDQELEFFLTRNKIISSMYGMSIIKPSAGKEKRICSASQKEASEWEDIEDSRDTRRLYNLIKDERIQEITISQEEVKKLDGRYCNVGSSKVSPKCRRMKEIAMDKKKFPISEKAEAFLNNLFSPQTPRSIHP